MDLHIYHNTIKLARQLLDTSKPTTPIINYFSQKPDFHPSNITPLPSASPESCGIPSSHIEAFLRELDDDPTLDIQGVCIYRHGKRLCDCSFGAYHNAVWHVTYSACKTLTGLAIGLLIEEGKLDLDEKVVDIFEKGRIAKLTHGFITVRHLLTMQSGIAMNEAASLTETEWVRSFFSSSANADGAFRYNSINSYILSAIVQKRSGQTLDAYLAERIFAPLGITNYFWEASPEGIVKGGWGLYMSPYDLAKIGLLYMNKGRWMGHALISEEWIADSISPQVKTPANIGHFDYGYHVWVDQEEGSFLLNGMFGQNVLGYPESGVMIVMTASNNELFQQGRLYEILKKYFSRPFGEPLKENASARSQLKSLCDKIGRKDAYLEQILPNRWYRLFHPFASHNNAEKMATLDGRTFILDKSTSVGLMPTFMQTVQNCYTAGISRIAFSLKNKELYCHVTEGGREFDFAVGFFNPAYTRLDFGQERHCVGVTGAFSQNEDNIPVLKIRLSFLETAHVRLMKCFFEEDGLRLVFDEKPGVDCIRKAMSDQRILQAALNSKNGDVIHFFLQRAFTPELFLKEKEL